LHATKSPSHHAKDLLHPLNGWRCRAKVRDADRGVPEDDAEDSDHHTKHSLLALDDSIVEQPHRAAHPVRSARRPDGAVLPVSASKSTKVSGNDRILNSIKILTADDADTNGCFNEKTMKKILTG